MISGGLGPPDHRQCRTLLITSSQTSSIMESVNCRVCSCFSYQISDFVKIIAILSVEIVNVGSHIRQK